jgi:hypothetical protein
VRKPNYRFGPQAAGGNRVDANHEQAECIRWREFIAPEKLGAYTRRRRLVTLGMRNAIGDLFLGLYRT